MEQSDHTLLAGEGALAFARAHGFREENLLTERSRKIWLYWKQTLSEKDDWMPPSAEKVDPEVAAFFKLDGHSAAAANRPTAQRESNPEQAKWTKFDRPTGTVHVAALDGHGDISCATSTSGLAFKLPGRLGDSPVVGAGLYVDNAIGSCGSTGRGEASLENVCSFAAVELMRHGREPQAAGLEILERVAAHTNQKHLLDDRGRPAFNLKLYLLRKDGAHAGVALWGPAEIAVADAAGTRLEECACLFQN
jgi:N4-(beta-N-acetylglucosaminyl)-L-asparaginase